MRALLLAVLIIAPVSALAAQQAPAAKPKYKRIVPTELAAESKISPDSAVTLALARVPGGEIQIMELEREKDRLIYSFDIIVPGKRGHHEVDIDALTGRALRVSNEP